MRRSTRCRAPPSVAAYRTGSPSAVKRKLVTPSPRGAAAWGLLARAAQRRSAARTRPSSPPLASSEAAPAPATSTACTAPTWTAHGEGVIRPQGAGRAGLTRTVQRRLQRQRARIPRLHRAIPRGGNKCFTRAGGHGCDRGPVAAQQPDLVQRAHPFPARGRVAGTAADAVDLDESRVPERARVTWNAAAGGVGSERGRTATCPSSRPTPRRAPSLPSNTASEVTPHRIRRFAEWPREGREASTSWPSHTSPVSAEQPATRDPSETRTAQSTGSPSANFDMALGLSA